MLFVHYNETAISHTISTTGLLSLIFFSGVITDDTCESSLLLASVDDAKENQCEKGADRINNASDVTSMLFGDAADDLLRQ